MKPPDMGHPILAERAERLCGRQAPVFLAADDLVAGKMRGFFAFGSE
jgi:hypothetical protein